MRERNIYMYIQREKKREIRERKRERERENKREIKKERAKSTRKRKKEREREQYNAITIQLNYNKIQYNYYNTITIPQIDNLLIHKGKMIPQLTN